MKKQVLKDIILKLTLGHRWNSDKSFRLEFLDELDEGRRLTEEEFGVVMEIFEEWKNDPYSY